MTKISNVTSLEQYLSQHHDSWEKFKREYALENSKGYEKVYKFISIRDEDFLILSAGAVFANQGYDLLAEAEYLFKEESQILRYIKLLIEEGLATNSYDKNLSPYYKELYAML
jgi:hypothetical protein